MQPGAQIGRSVVRRFTVSSVDREVAHPYTWEELAARVDVVPDDALVRGMFLREITRLAPASVRKPYVPFGLYRVREYLQLLVLTGRTLHPTLAPASALIELGLGVYGTFASSLAGMALLSATGSDFGRTCALCSRGYAMTTKPGEALLIHAGKESAEIHLRNVWSFPEIFHCGIWLGAMRACRSHGTITVTSYSDCDADLALQWERDDG